MAWLSSGDKSCEKKCEIFVSIKISRSITFLEAILTESDS